MLLTADRLFDGTGTAPLQRAWMQVSQGRITALGSGNAPPDPEPPHAFPGGTILPGLIDTHVHLVFSALPTHEAIIAQVTTETDEQLLERALGNARAALQAGLTTVRDCGGRGRIVQEARNRIRGGAAEGPDILACGMPITTTGGHCHWLGLTADNEAAAVVAAERMLRSDVDFLKVMATGGNMTAESNPLKPQYDAATLMRIADLGRGAHKHTAAHVLSRSAIPQAIAARIRTIEHCDWRVNEKRYLFDPDLARRLIDQEQYVGLTMSGLTRRKFLPELAEEQSKPFRRLDARFACERQMIDFGVRYTLHSDAGVRLTPFDRFALGLRAAVHELKLTPSDAIRAATGTAAEALGLLDRGVLAPGKRADVLVVDGNPLADIATLERVRAVLKAGRWAK
jgi:imidazolonepropionase-like amidohydrolase